MEDEKLLNKALREYGEKIAVGIDCKDGYVCGRGWLQKSSIHYIEFAKRLEKLGVKNIIVTDISKDGTLEGPNIEMLNELKKEVCMDITASGGIRDVCLDVKEGRVVKGVNFVGLKDVGNPVDLAEYYYKAGADELVFLDITATHEGRGIMRRVVEKVAEKIFIPFTVGGGLKNLEDIKEILRAGADKVSLNSAAVRDKQLIKKGAYYFGNQCIVLAVDAKKREDNTGWNVVINGGRIDTGIDALRWIEEGIRLGAGEILLTSMDADGTKKGFDIELTKSVSNITNVPVIASGGCGELEHFYEVFKDEVADAALAASLFHYGELSVEEVKKYLKDRNISVRY